MKSTHVSESKKEVVKELSNLFNKKPILIASIKNLKAAQFQEIKKKLRGKAIVKVAKKNLVGIALDSMKDEYVKGLGEYIKEDCALIFSDTDAFEISAFLSENKSPAKARAGQTADEDIRIEPGLTELVPGPDISALGAVGLKVKVENGKLAIQQAHVLIKKSEVISEQKVSILSKLGISPFKIGLEPVVAFCDGKIYKNVKIDKEAFIKELEGMFAKSLAFGVSFDYVTPETLPFVLAKAASHENALGKLIKTDSN